MMELSSLAIAIGLITAAAFTIELIVEVLFS